jgi:hypothetical protein
MNRVAEVLIDQALKQRLAARPCFPSLFPLSQSKSPKNHSATSTPNARTNRRAINFEDEKLADCASG